MQSSEFNRVFLLGMSNSEVVLIKGDHHRHQEVGKIDCQEFPVILKRSSLTCTARDDEIKEEEICIKETIDDDERRRPGLEELTATAADDDEYHDRRDHDDDNKEKEEEGFKTPTSLDHKIPVIKQCPPAPRKPKPPKRKRASSDVRRTLLLDLSREVDAMFPKPIFDDLHNKIKKARRDDDNIN